MLTNEDYSPEGIKNVSTEAIKRELEAIEHLNLSYSESGFVAEQEGKMGLAFACASVIGVNKIKRSILDDELKSREFADRLSRGEVDFADLLDSLFK